MTERHTLARAYRACALVAIWILSASMGFADLVAHWKLDEGDDTEFLNSVDDNYDGYLFDDTVIVNVVDVEPNADGYGPDQELAIEFTGDNSWIQTDFPGIGGNEPRTVAFWVKTEVADDAPSHGIVGWGATADTEKWHIRVNNNSGDGVLGAIRTEPQGGQNVASTPISDGQWHHVASVFPDGATTISELLHYVDGRLDPRSGGTDQTVNTRIGDGAEPVTIGMRIQGATFEFFPGIVADVRIYDEALEEDEIRELAGLGGVPECDSLSIACEVDEELNNVALTATADPDGCDCDRLEFFADDVSIGVSDVPADGRVDLRLDLACVDPGSTVELKAVCLGSGTSATCQLTCPSRQGLVAHWRLDEGDGDNFEDSAGDFDGFLPAGSTIEWTDGPPTQEFAVEFSGLDSWIQTDFPGIGGANPRTVTFWVRTVVANDAPSHGIVGWGASSTSEKWHIRVNNNAGNGVPGAIRTEPEGGQNVATTPINDGEWHHIASVFPEGAMMISEVLHYVDGVLDPRSGGGEQTVNTRIGPNAEPVTIGMRLQGTTPHFFPGAVADVRIYDRALEEDEIVDVMLDEGTGPTEASIRPGDVNGDGAVNISDPVAALDFLFGGGQSLVECYFSAGGDGSIALTEAGRAVLDWNGDGSHNITDAVGSLTFQFASGAPHVLGEDCTLIPGDCGDSCR